MSLQVLTNCKILAGAADLSGYSNKVALDAEAAELDSTTWDGTGWESIELGLKKVSIDVSGLWSASDATHPDERLWTDTGSTTGQPMTVAASATVGDVAYFSRVKRPKFDFGADVGQLVEFTTSARGDGTALVRGELADNTSRTATGTTTVRSLTAPGATTRVMASLHIVSWSGTGTVTATLQGDNAVGFPSPATVVAGSALSAVGSQFLAGAYGVNADSYFRLSYVVTGTPTFTVVAAIGVGA